MVAATCIIVFFAIILAIAAAGGIIAEQGEKDGIVRRGQR
jgi:hypothetical protein